MSNDIKDDITINQLAEIVADGFSRMATKEDLQQIVLMTAQGFEHVTEEIGGLKADVGELKQDVSVLKKDVSILKEDVSVIKKQVSHLDFQIDGIRESLNDFVAHDISDLQHRVTRLEKTTRA